MSSYSHMQIAFFSYKKDYKTYKIWIEKEGKREREKLLDAQLNRNSIQEEIR